LSRTSYTPLAIQAAPTATSGAALEAAQGRVRVVDRGVLGVALLGVLPGIAIAMALSILNVFRRAWWPYDTELGRVEGLEGYHDVHTHPDAQHLPGLVIYRFDAPLFFANATTFRDEVRKLASAELTRTIDPRHFFPTVGSAVAAFRQMTGAEWTAAGQAIDDGTGLGRTGAETGPPRDVPALPPAGYS
jgi:hypothetical protein